MATAMPFPTTDLPPSTQSQSPLFRIPLEIHDEIYAHYVFEEAGCVYNPATSTLRLASGRALHLLYTCKAGAGEPPRALLRTNRITVRPLHIECLLHYVRWTKMLMLRHAASFITPEILDRVVERYPGVEGYFRCAFGAIRGKSEHLCNFYLFPHGYRDNTFASFCDAVQYTLELASIHPQFGHLVAEASGHSQADLGRAPFVAGSHWKILHWKPALWSLPTEVELSSIEREFQPADYDASKHMDKYGPIYLVDYENSDFAETCGFLPPDWYMNVIVDWITRTAAPPSIDMPVQSFFEVIEPYESIDEVFFRPRRLSSTYPTAVRDIIQGNSIIHFDGEPGELWDRQAMSQFRVHWSTEDFLADYQPVRMIGTYFQVPGGTQALWDLYKIEGGDDLSRAYESSIDPDHK
ncbi:hypothetical protein K458DRAFT_383362 [Lentithecium fluviatile CBS 122367]|uniref:Uncharacterized protein n=1 Tax=Lentithecium fluviatile CBS 122367 TaxID=1168545 RepID=A0A6G1JI44_9PLEO|nr:hypothetical protein K458DRAFT_383362 [Lentithecium fluviatile CBS 122367]